MGRYVKINGELVPIADMGGESQSTNFVGTLADWEALTQEQKNAYDSVDLIDDFSDEITEELDALNDRVGDLETSVESLQGDISTGITRLAAVKTGKMVTLNTLSNGIPDVTTSGIQLPTALYPKQWVRTACMYISGSNWVVGWLQITSAGKLIVYVDNTGGTTTATSGLCFSITYELANP